MLHTKGCQGEVFVACVEVEPDRGWPLVAGMFAGLSPGGQQGCSLTARMAGMNPVEQKWPGRPHAGGPEARLVAALAVERDRRVAARWPGMPVGQGTTGAAGCCLAAQMLAGIRSSRDSRDARTHGGPEARLAAGIAVERDRRRCPLVAGMLAGREMQGRQGCSLVARMTDRNPIEQ